MSTTVLLRVTPAEPIDAERWVGEVPADVAALLRAAGQRAPAALERSGSGPERLRFQLGGPDRVAVGQQLCARLRAMGYDAEVCFSP